MKIGLAAYEFRNNDIAFNLSQMERAMKSVQGKVGLLCFGEAFLQGFDALSWNYEADQQTALSSSSPSIERLCAMTRKYGVDILFGYIEKDQEAIHSSCAVIEKGTLLHNYRRISKGWKEYTITDGHYQEGNAVHEFLYQNQPILIALCGDLWDFPERFQTESLLIWPVYVNFTLAEWEKYVQEYARQAALACRRTLLVNPLSKEPPSHGGAFHFADGAVAESLPFDTEGILIVDI